MIISEKIFALLEQRGMSQKEFSERTGISQSTISDWKRKQTNPSADKILKICEVLVCLEVRIIFRDHEEPSQSSSELSLGCLVFFDFGT